MSMEEILEEDDESCSYSSQRYFVGGAFTHWIRKHMWTYLFFIQRKEQYTGQYEVTHT